MKLADLYKGSKKPYIVLIITFLCLIMTTAIFLRPDLYDIVCLKTNPEHFWQYASGIFIHGAQPRWFIWVHLIMNLFALLPFGILAEKTLGSRTIFLMFTVEWFVTSILFQITTQNAPTTAAGISTICYMFATIAFYIAILVWKQNKKSFWKQPLAYYFVFEFLGMLSMLNPLGGITTFLLHLSGVFIGIIFIIISHIKQKIESLNKLDIKNPLEPC